MIGAGLHNIPLTRYLIQQVLQSSEDRMAALREYMPTAQAKDWELKEAGYRVQIIKPDSKQGGMLQFGTEVIVS
jgi:malate dehydrogenase (quinone)